MTTVIYHSADFDGLFCREIARKFLPNAQFIGWDFADPPLDSSVTEGELYVLDLPIDALFGKKGFGRVDEMDFSNLVWIDHHASSIASHPAKIPGYRIDGVAACRLAWQWFWLHATLGYDSYPPLPDKQAFIERRVTEPLAVTLAGEYDVWQKNDPRADVFQFGLRSRELTPQWWDDLLRVGELGDVACQTLLDAGELLQRYQQDTDAGIVNHRSFLTEFEGLKCLALNTARCNSLTFAAKDVPETGHDALMAFYFSGKKWTVSLYHARHRTDIDLSKIAVKHGGGGHRGAAGMVMKTLPFLAQ